MSPDELAAELGRGDVRPAYLLAGTELLLRDDALARIRAAVLRDAGADWNLDRLEGDATRAGGLIDAVRALPVMAERRLVVLREPEAGRGGKALTEALADLLPEVLGQTGTVLVVLAAKADRRARWTKAFTEPGVRIDCDPPKNAKAALSFVREEAARQGLQVDAQAASALVDAVGPELLMLRQELAKAALYAGDTRITAAHVRETASEVAEEPIWDLTDAIGEGRTASALAVLDRLLGSGAAPPLVLGSLASHFRKLLRVRSGGKVSGHPFAVRKLESQGRRYTVSRLEACLGAIHEVDEILKGQGGIAPGLALERLVLGLAG